MGAPRLATVAWVMDWSEKLAPLLLSIDASAVCIGASGVGAGCFSIGAIVGSLRDHIVIFWFVWGLCEVWSGQLSPRYPLCMPVSVYAYLYVF